MPIARVFRLLSRSRLVQFAVLGGLLYGVSGARDDRRVVDVDPTVLADLEHAQASKLGVARLSDDGKREVDARVIEDEVLYREALKLGLDKDDPLIRQRLVQKLLLLVEDMGGASADPSDAELRAYFEATRARWRRPISFRFVHVYAREPQGLPGADALTSVDTALSMGEPFPYPRDVTLTREAIERILGPAVREAVTMKLAPGTVSEPVRSPFGWHRIRLVERVEGAPATFEEARSAIAIDFLMDRRERVVGAYLQKTAASYDLRVGGAPLTNFIPTRRVAARTEGSAED